MHLLSKTMGNKGTAFSILCPSALPSAVENGTMDTPAAEPEDMAAQTSEDGEREGEEEEQEDLIQFEPTQEELERERLAVRAEQVSSYAVALVVPLRLLRS